MHYYSNENLERKCAELSWKEHQNWKKRKEMMFLRDSSHHFCLYQCVNHGGRVPAGAHTHLSCSTSVRLWNRQRRIITVISVRWAKTCQSKTHESWHIKRFGSFKRNLPSKPWLATLQVILRCWMRERISLEWSDRSFEIWGLDGRVGCLVESNSIPECQLNRFSKRDVEL